MNLVATLRNWYRKHINLPLLDRAIYLVLDFLTNIYAYLAGWSFPKKYIRRWKLDLIFNLYEKETVNLFLKKIKPGMVVIDIGAHIGYFTRLYSKLVGPSGMIYAYEADPDNFSLLKKNTAKLKNVKIFQLAISDHVGEIDFYHYDDKAGCNSTLPNVPLDYAKIKITVPCSDLDSVLLGAGVKQVDLIKMDIEGGEGTALRGMNSILKNNQNLQLVTEFAPAWVKASGQEPIQFLQNLTEQGFKLFAIKGEELHQIIPVSPESYLPYIPKTPTAFNEFINIYCTRS